MLPLGPAYVTLNDMVVVTDVLFKMYYQVSWKISMKHFFTLNL